MWFFSTENGKSRQNVENYFSYEITGAKLSNVSPNGIRGQKYLLDASTFLTFFHLNSPEERSWDNN